MELTEQEKIRLLEPYSKMTLPELYEAFCSNPDLRKKLGWQGNIGTVAYVWLDFADYIRELFPASPLQVLKDIKWLEVEFISKNIMADVLRKTVPEYISLEQKEYDVLCTLDDSYPVAMTIVDIAATPNKYIDRGTATEKLRQLKEKGFAEQKSERKGWAITQRGRDLLRKTS